MFFTVGRQARVGTVHERAQRLTNRQLARTITSMARTYDIVDPYRSAVLDEAADRLLAKTY